MAPVSKKQLSEKAFQKIHRRFGEIIASLKTRHASEAFFDELLAPTERVILAKRLSIIFMLLEGASSYTVHRTLKVSTSTVLRIRKRLDQNGFPFVQKYFRKRTERERFWHDLEVVVRLGMPPMGKGRWTWLYEMEQKYGTPK